MGWRKNRVGRGISHAEILFEAFSRQVDFCAKADIVVHPERMGDISEVIPRECLQL